MGRKQTRHPSHKEVAARSSRPTPEELKQNLLELQALDQKHRACSRSRKWIERFSRGFSKLVGPSGLLDLVRPLADANPASAVSVGGVKFILTLLYRTSDSYNSLAKRTEKLTSVLESAEIYAHAQDWTPESDKDVDTVLLEVETFLKLARRKYINSSGKLRGFGFRFHSYHDIFAEIDENIDTASANLDQLAGAKTHNNTVIILHKLDEGEKRKYLKSLNPVIVDNVWGRFRQIRATGTCGWVLDDESAVKTWRESPSPQFLLLTGKTGCGKTMIVSRIVETLAEETSIANTERASPGIVCSYTIEHDDEGKGHDAASTIRTLLFQALKQRRDLIEPAAAMSDKWGGFPNLAISQILEIMLTTIQNMKHDQVYIVLDGLDKYEPRPLDDLVPALNKIHEQPNVKLLVTCRDINLHKMSPPRDTPKFDISSKTTKDLRLIVSATIARLLPVFRLGTTEEHDLIERLMSKADNSTLWATLMLKILMKSNSQRYEELRDLIDKTPLELETLYLRQLESIDLTQRAEAARALHLLSLRWSRRLLTVDEFRHALASYRIYQTRDALEEALPRKDYFQTYLERLLGVLIRVEGGYVALAHRSVAQFLHKLADSTAEVTAGILPMIPSEVRSIFGCSEPRSTLLVAAASIYYLRTCDLCGLLDDATQIPSLRNKWDFFGRMRVDDDCGKDTETASSMLENLPFPTYHPAPFFDYAACYWNSHIRALCTMKVTSTSGHKTSVEKVFAEIPEVLFQTINALSDWRAGASCRWARHFLETTPSKYYRDKLTSYKFSPLMVAVLFQQEYVISHILHNYFANINPIEFTHALALTSERSSKHIVMMLGAWFWQRANHEKEDISLYPALFEGARAGRADSVDTILKYLPDMDVTLHCTDKHSPLSIAVAKGSVSVVERLLKAPQLDRASLQDVIFSVNVGIVKMLRTLLEDSRIDLARRNQRGRSLLSYAAEFGRCDIADLLLSASGPDRSAQVQSLINDTGDKEGKTPVWYASCNNHVSILELLCSRGDMKAQVECKSILDGETALYAAARTGHTESISFLASRWKSSLYDHDGGHRTLLSATAFAEEDRGAKAAQELLQHGAANDIEAESDDGLTALQYAVKASRLELMKVLVLEGGANTDKVLTMNDEGDVHLLTRPAAEGMVETVRQEMISLVKLRDEAIELRLVNSKTFRSTAESVRRRQAFVRAFGKRKRARRAR